MFYTVYLQASEKPKHIFTLWFMPSSFSFLVHLKCNLPAILSSCHPNSPIYLFYLLSLLTFFPAPSISMHGLDPTNPSFLFSLTLLTTRQFTFHNYSDWHGCLLGSFVELIITSSKDFSCFVELVQILYSQRYLPLNRSLTGSKPQTGEYNLSTFMPVCTNSPLWRPLLVS